MKKIIYLLIVLGAVFTSCDPLEDINTEIDAIPEEPNVGTFEYTLTDEDYSILELDPASFNSNDQAKQLLPDFLSGLYPLYGEGSSVNVGYNLFVGPAEGISDFTDADSYTLTNDDYASFGSDAFGFYPDETPEDFIPAILDAQVTSPVEGQLIRANFRQYVEDPVIGLANLFEYNFDGTFDGFTVVDIVNPSFTWTSRPGEVQASGFDGDPNETEDWLVSPALDLTGESNLKFQMNQRVSFLNAEPYNNHINILVSTDYTGDVTTATWDTITLAMVPDGTTSDFVLSEDYDFSAYDGQTITLAFKYNADDVVAPLWRIDMAAIKTLGIEGDTESLGEYYMYSGGSWELAEDVYYLSSADYDSMGEGSGQPGRFDNFSNSVAPENYLPAFLRITYPFAQEEDEISVIFKFFDGGVSTRGDKYTFTNGQWTPHQSTIATTLQFGFVNGEWVPDNTIRYTLVTADYDLVASTLLNEPGFEAAAGNLENFGNFNRTGGGTSWSDEMLVTAFDIVLDNNNPSAEDDQKYVMIFDVFDGSSGTEEFKMIKTGGEWISNQ